MKELQRKEVEAPAFAIPTLTDIQEDVKLMKEMGLDAFRFCISWSRLLPHGHLRGGINEEGVRFCNNLINELISNGVKPFVTLFHWDSPQDLEDKYGGFLSSKIVPDFGDYAELCFREFGDRVKHWITLNEPFSYSAGGIALGLLAPGRCSPSVGNCTGGNSGTEPYMVGHNSLLAHANAVKHYRDKYQASQNGTIGVTLVSHWMVPFPIQWRCCSTSHRLHVRMVYGSTGPRRISTYYEIPRQQSPAEIH